MVLQPRVSRIRRLQRLDAASGRLEAAKARKAANDHRWAKRKLAGLTGFIVSDRLSQSIRCTVCDTSSSGALIELAADDRQSLASATELPDRFTLVMQRYRERTDVECVVVRRMGMQVGVRFVSQFMTVETGYRSYAARKPGG